MEHGLFVEKEETIRDRFILGLQDQELSQKLQLENDLALDKAVTTARQYELVKTQIKEQRQGAVAAVGSFSRGQHVVVGLIVGLDPSRQAQAHVTHRLVQAHATHCRVQAHVTHSRVQAHVTHSSVQGVAPSTRRKLSSEGTKVSQMSDVLAFCTVLQNKDSQSS